MWDEVSYKIDESKEVWGLNLASENNSCQLCSCSSDKGQQPCFLMQNLITHWLWLYQDESSSWGTSSMGWPKSIAGWIVSEPWVEPVTFLSDIRNQAEADTLKSRQWRQKLKIKSCHRVMDTCMCMAETNTTLLIGYTPIQNKKFKKKKTVIK